MPSSGVDAPARVAVSDLLHGDEWHVLQHLLVLLFLEELLGRPHLGDDDAGISRRLLELVSVAPRDGLVDRRVVVRAVEERQGLLMQSRVDIERNHMARVPGGAEERHFEERVVLVPLERRQPSVDLSQRPAPNPENRWNAFRTSMRRSRPMRCSKPPASRSAARAVADGLLHRAARGHSIDRVRGSWAARRGQPKPPPIRDSLTVDSTAS
jgi:hypothetical protein